MGPKGGGVEAAGIVGLLSTVHSMPKHSSDLSSFPTPPPWLSRLPPKDPWSTPFAESLLEHLDIFQGASVLDVACGEGIPAFYLANQVGHTGRVLGVDVLEAQLIRARAIQGPYFPWLDFRQGDVRCLPPELGTFDRITGNLSFMFFRPDRPKALAQLRRFLKPGGQMVLTFPSLGTFDSLWEIIHERMVQQGLDHERRRFSEYINERPSAEEASRSLQAGGLTRVNVKEYPLEVPSGSGPEFLSHPLLRGGFLDDVYECFTDPDRAETFMDMISQEVDRFRPLIAQRCVMSGWVPG